MRLPAAITFTVAGNLVQETSARSVSERAFCICLPSAPAFAGGARGKSGREQVRARNRIVRFTFVKERPQLSCLNRAPSEQGFFMDRFESYCAIAVIAGFLLLAVLIPILGLR
jgi:hypothetical protein